MEVGIWSAWPWCSSCMSTRQGPDMAATLMDLPLMKSEPVL